MNVWLVLPVKSLRDGKTRLSPALNDQERRALIEELLARTLLQAAEFPGLDRTLVVSACAEVRATAQSYGARVLAESAPHGLNSALCQAQKALLKGNTAQMLMVSADLPLLSAQELRDLAGASSAKVVAIAPDRARQGTNGLCLPVSAPFDFSFGVESFERHLAATDRLGMASGIVERRGLAFDVDTPEQLAEIAFLTQHADDSVEPCAAANR